MESLSLNPASFAVSELTAPDPTAWYTDQTIVNIEPDMFPWMLAQGYVVFGYNTSSTWWEDEEGDGHFTYYCTYNMKRRTLDSEKILSTLVQDYVAAYNDGRQINSQRYDDIVAVFDSLLTAYNTEGAALETGDTAYKALAEAIFSYLESDYTTYNSNVENSLDDYGDSHRDRIEEQFDIKESKAITSLISRGLYNTAVLSSLQAGFAREEGIANTDVEDKITEMTLKHKRDLYVLKVDMRKNILAARDRLRAMIHAHEDTRLVMRNRIVEALVGFMERRTDAYPDITAIGKVAAELGAGIVSGPATNVYQSGTV